MIPNYTVDFGPKGLFFLLSKHHEGHKIILKNINWPKSTTSLEEHVNNFISDPQVVLKNYVFFLIFK